MTTTTTDLAPLLARLDAMSAELSYIAERQRRQEELFEELAPIARAAVATAIERLDQLEQKGYFAFGKELLGVGQRIVEGFSPTDVHQLGDAVVSILDTVRTLTQPEVLAIASDASHAMQDADAVKPLGIFGMVRATKNDDVQKGMALMVEVLRRVGHGANALATRHQLATDRKAKLAELLGPRRDRKLLGIERPRLTAGSPPAPRTPANPAAACGPGMPAAPGAVIDGIAYTVDGHLVDAAAWSPELGRAIAQLQSVELADHHWVIIEAARAEFAATGASPNIKRLTQVASVSTKDLYTLFPKAPARTIAKIAGLPKPAGCL